MDRCAVGSQKLDRCAVRSWKLDCCWKLDRIHEGFLYLIENDDTHAKQYDHKGKAIAEHPPFVIAHTQHAVLEKLYNARKRIELHD